jgi:hypothetical protein
MTSAEDLTGALRSAAPETAVAIRTAAPMPTELYRRARRVVPLDAENGFRDLAHRAPAAAGPLPKKRACLILGFMVMARLTSIPHGESKAGSLQACSRKSVYRDGGGHRAESPLSIGRAIAEA